MISAPLADQSFLTGHLHRAGWLGKLITQLLHVVLRSS